MQPNDLLTLSKEKLVDKLQELNLQEEQTMASMVMIREELLHRLEEEKKDGEIIGEYSVTKAKRVNFKTSIEQAQELGAIKQAVDTGVLRKLYNKGIKVPGVEITTYLSVRRLAQEEAEK
jgi:hypothetical protein